jgi:thioredoxin-like negative regulator of GroEL
MGENGGSNFMRRREGPVKEAWLARNEAVKKMRADSSALGIILATISKAVLKQSESMIDLRTCEQYGELFDNLPQHKKDDVRQTLSSRLIVVSQGMT